MVVRQQRSVDGCSDPLSGIAASDRYIAVNEADASYTTLSIVGILRMEGSNQPTEADHCPG
jgi:hypothetical protein